MLVAWFAFLCPTASAGSAATAEYARQVSTAQVRLAELEALLSESELRIEQLEEVIRQQGKTQAQRLDNFDEVNAEVVRLRGAIEVLQFETSEVKRLVSDQQVSSERRQLHAEMRLAQIEKLLSLKPPPPPTDAQLGLTSSPPSPVPPGGTATAPVPTPESPAPDPATPSDLPDNAAGKLAAAKDQASQGRHTVARAILASAIQQHVNAPEMDEIRYRYAETFYATSDWRAAITEYNKVINNHPSSPRKCWAFHQQGLAFEAMGQKEGAKAFFKGATEGTCKTSEASKEARKKLN